MNISEALTVIQVADKWRELSAENTRLYEQIDLLQKYFYANDNSKTVITRIVLHEGKNCLLEDMIISLFVGEFFQGLIPSLMQKKKAIEAEMQALPFPQQEAGDHK